MASNGLQRLFIPNSSMPTAEVVAKTISDASVDTTNNYLKFGWDDTAEKYYRGIITVKLPLLEDVFGDVTTGLYNSDTPVGDIENIAIRLDPSNQLTNIGKYHIYKIKKYSTQFATGINGSFSTAGGHSTNHISTDTVTWNGYADSEMNKDSDVDGHEDGTIFWQTAGAFVKGTAAKMAVNAGTDLDQGTDYGHGANGIIHMFNVENHGSSNTLTIPLKPLLDGDSFTWGDTFQLLIKHEGAVNEGYGQSDSGDDGDAEWGDEAHNNVETLITCTASTFGSTVSSSLVQVEIIYKDEPPAKPIIKLSADPTDFITPIVTFSTFPSDADLQNVALHFNTSNAFTFNASPGSEVRTVLSTFNAESYRDLESTTFLNTAGTKNYFLTAIANDNTSYVQGNVINKGRMQCSGAIVSTTSIGTQVTLTVTGSNGDYSGKFAKVGVNWNSGASDNTSDYRIVTLTEEATSTTITHTYDASGVFQVKLFTVDRDGFRSGKTNAPNTTTVKPIGTTDRAAVAKLSTNRDTVVRARYGDSFSVVTLSGAQGYAVGSDKRVGTYLFKHNNSSDANPLTTNPLGNNNDSFNAVSAIVKLRCNQAGRDGTSLKVWGWCSVEADGTPIADNSANFDHYEWQVHSISPHASANTVGTQAQTAAPEDVYYKSVEFVALDAIDAADNGTATSVGTVNRYVLVDGAGNIINSEIRGTADDYSFGGYITSGDITVVFHDTNKTIERSSGSFLTDGFEVGDIVMIGGSLEDSVNNIFTKITVLTATIMTVEDDLEDGDGSNANVKILKAQGPTLQVAAYDESAPTFTHKIVPININQSAAVNDIEKGGADATNNTPVSTEVTQQVTFESEEYHTYDFDTEADAGNISILTASLSRRGGITGSMPLGQGRYPISPTRTSLGLPTMTISLRAHTQAGYRKLWNLIQGDRYEWSTIDSKKVDSPDTAFRQLRLKMIDGSLNKDPSLASEYTANINFLVIGELVT